LASTSKRVCPFVTAALPLDCLAALKDGCGAFARILSSWVLGLCLSSPVLNLLSLWKRGELVMKPIHSYRGMSDEEGKALQWTDDPILIHSVTRLCPSFPYTSRDYQVTPPDAKGIKCTESSVAWYPATSTPTSPFNPSVTALSNRLSSPTVVNHEAHHPRSCSQRGRQRQRARYSRQHSRACA
jgi:hypothetical protein